MWVQTLKYKTAQAKYDLRDLQSPPKALKQWGEFLCFCNKLNTVGVEIKRWARDKSSEFQLLFPGIYTWMSSKLKTWHIWYQTTTFLGEQKHWNREYLSKWKQIRFYNLVACPFIAMTSWCPWPVSIISLDILLSGWPPSDTKTLIWMDHFGNWGLELD